MADDLDIPRRFLEQIVGAFKERGLRRSLLGVNRGYRFSKDPTAISMREIFHVTEGSFFQWTAASKTLGYAHVTPSRRVIQNAWSTLPGSVNNVPVSITLQPMCHRATQLQFEGPGVALAPGRSSFTVHTPYD